MGQDIIQYKLEKVKVEDKDILYRLLQYSLFEESLLDMIQYLCVHVGVWYSMKKDNFCFKKEVMITYGEIQVVLWI